MMPPTLAVLGDLARFDDVASALTAERRIVTVQIVTMQMVTVQILTVQPVLRLVRDRLEFGRPV